MFPLLYILTTATVLCWLILKYLKGTEKYWESLNVPVVDLSQLGSKWDRTTQVIPPDVMEKKIYALAKATKAKFFGLIQNGVPVFIPLDLDLIKSIAVKDFDHFRNRRLLLPPLEFEPLLQKMLLAAKDQEWRDLVPGQGCVHRPGNLPPQAGHRQAR